MRTIEHDGATETIFSPDYPAIGCFIGETGFPYVFFTQPTRRFCLFMARSGLRYRPRVAPVEPGSRDWYLVLRHRDTGETATISTDSQAEFMRALSALGVLN